MRVLREFAKIVLGSVFSILLTLLLISFSLSQITEYSNLKGIFSSLIKTQKEMNVTEIYNNIKIVCKFEKTINMPINNDTIQLECSEVEKIKEDDFLEFLSSKIFDKFYFKEYSCSVIECLKEGKAENFLVIFSSQGNLFFQTVKKYLIFLTIIACLAFLLVLENWEQRAKGLGKALLSTGLFYFIIKFGSDFFLPAKIKELAFAEKILNSFAQNFLYIFVAGIILLIIGYLLKRKSK
jgi:hypothetical protein